MMLNEKCVCFYWGCRRNRGLRGKGGWVGVLMQVLNMQCASDLTGYREEEACKIYKSA